MFGVNENAILLLKGSKPARSDPVVKISVLGSV